MRDALSVTPSLKAKATLACALLLVCGCTKSVAIASEASEVVPGPPNAGAVHPYEGLPLNTYDGRSIAVYFSSSDDLGAVSRDRAHHLYFEVIPCNGMDQGADLFSGTVFNASDADRLRLRLAVDGKRVYKLHVPLDLAVMRNRARGIGGLDAARLLGEIEKSGVCAKLGGGTMQGTGIESNMIRVPLVLRRNTLQLQDGVRK